jgi:hypothetical protein
MNQQEHYQEIADKIDQYSEADKDFMLWYLLGNYRAYLESESGKINPNPDNVSDYAMWRMMRDHFMWAEDIRNVLQEVIF